MMQIRILLLVISFASSGLLFSQGPEPKSVPPMPKEKTINDKLIEAIELDMTGHVKKALNEGASPHATNEKGVPVLILAVESGNKRIVELLLEKGADVNSMSGMRTPLMIAAGSSNKNMVKLLFDHGADPKLQNDEGDRALDFAQRAPDRDKEGTIQLLKGAGVK